MAHENTSDVRQIFFFEESKLTLQLRDRVETPDGDLPNGPMEVNSPSKQ